MTEERDWLDEALADSPHIDDAGFTQRVMSQLPARRQRTWVRDGILALAALAGGLLAFVFTPGARLLGQAAVDLARYQPGASLPVVSLVLLLALTVVGAILVQER